MISVVFQQHAYKHARGHGQRRQDRTAGTGDALALTFARKGDSLVVVWGLDRLGRSPPELVKIVGNLETADIGFESTREYIEASTTTERLVFHVFAALAEFEWRLIVERKIAGTACGKNHCNSGAGHTK